MVNIVVCVKYVPDATGDRHFAEDLTTDRDAVDGLLSELDEYAVEQALQIAENADDAQVTVLTVGPEDAKDALRKALSMGADKAVHVEDGALHGTDAMGTSLVLAKGDRAHRLRPRRVRYGLHRRHDGCPPGDPRRAAGCPAGDAAVRGRGRRREGHRPA
jgi:hypothetical protein